MSFFDRWLKPNKDQLTYNAENLRAWAAQYKTNAALDARLRALEERDR